MNWHYSPDGDQRIEVTAEQFATLVQNGTIRRDTLVWREGLPDWAAAAQSCPELFPAAAPLVVGAAAEAPGPVVGTPAAGPPPTPPMVGTFDGIQQMDMTAVASLIAGILGLFPGICCCALGIPAAVTAVVCGHLSLGRIKKFPANLRGRELAVVGLILGYLGLAWLLVSIVIKIVSMGLSAALDSSTHFRGIR